MANSSRQMDEQETNRETSQVDQMSEGCLKMQTEVAVTGTFDWFWSFHGQLDIFKKISRLLKL